MLEIKFAKKFKKSFKKLGTNDKALFYEVAFKLANNEILEPKFKDHALKGEFKDFRECHIKPDLLLIYQKLDKELFLLCIDIGSHSELF